MEENENSFMRNWIYSYLRYGHMLTPEQLRQTEDDFLKLLKEQREIEDEIENEIKKKQNRE